MAKLEVLTYVYLRTFQQHPLVRNGSVKTMLVLAVAPEGTVEWGAKQTF